MAPLQCCLVFFACVTYVSAARPSCVTSCDGLPDGDYQSCRGCNVYASCSGGLLYDKRPCAPGGLMWDDNKRRCDWTSTTCPPPGPDTCTDTGKCCVSSCKDVKDGYYQSCYGCGIYVTCHANMTYDFRPCAPSPSGLVWNDTAKTCSWNSDTCTCRVKQVFVCQRDYLHPEAPNAHLTCPTGQKIRVVRANFGRTLPDNQICQAGYHHDDDVNCVSPDSLQRAKATCDNKEDCILAPTAGTFRDSCTGTYKYLNVSYVCEGGASDDVEQLEATKGRPNPCITSCKGLKDGFYQSCRGCDVYAACVNGVLLDNQPCPKGTVWDDNLKTCLWQSDTCQ